MGQIQYSEK
ncbi:hypothetical protein SOVF_014670, partial [Spinacia oleracea]